MLPPAVAVALADPVPTAVEALVLVLALLFTRRFPRGAAGLAVLASVAVAYVLQPQLFGEPRQNVTLGTDVIRKATWQDGVGGQTTMRAALFGTGVDGEHAITVGEAPIPNHGDEEILIRVEGAALNPSNFKVNLRRLPFVRHANGGVHAIGYDVAGVVLSVGGGRACKGVALGDAVYGFASGGSIAEYARMSCKVLAAQPMILNATQSAGLPVAALTSLMAWERTGLKKGDKVMVIGASGGCGMFGVSIAKILGAGSVTGTCVRWVDALENVRVLGMVFGRFMGGCVSATKRRVV